jgi:hypothetical protein
MKQNEASDAGLLTGSENPLHSLKVECYVDHVLLPCTSTGIDTGIIYADPRRGATELRRVWPS